MFQVGVLLRLNFKFYWYVLLQMYYKVTLL